MDGMLLARPFARMGARVSVVRDRSDDGVRVDVKRDRHGQFFEVLAGDAVRVVVPDVRPEMRHLLMLAQPLGGVEKHKFLCGHDEREWFAAAVPNQNGVSSVRTAMEALKPADVRAEAARRAVRSREFASRRTAAYRRQGEWFFIPRPGMRVKDWLIRRDEPMTRGRGKAHIAQFAFREGGEVVYTAPGWTRAVTQAEHARLLHRNAHARKARWVVGMRNPDLYVRGRVSHPDHAPIVLDDWHMVRMNTESEAPSMRHLAFID